MSTRDLNELKANPKNPRQINKHDYAALVESVKQFGDLSGIVLNIRTGQLVGGHQRTEVFKRMGGAVAIHKEDLPAPNSVGTVAYGYVEMNGERYGYREVDWDENRESAANIAANRIQGQFDLDVLAEVTYELAQLEDKSLLALTGQTEDETARLLKMVSGFGAADESEQGKLDEQKMHRCPNCNYEGSENEFRTGRQSQA
jgi:hypothetical protein